MARPIHYQVTPSTISLQGSISVLGDKSISHRAVILASLAKGTSHFSGFLMGADNLAAIKALQQMGVKIDYQEKKHAVSVEGVGLHGLREPPGALDCGNSGTAMRLLAGLLAGQSFASQLVGDASLMQRPMQRIAKPLALMQADIHLSEQGTPPVHISPAKKLTGIYYEMPVASAQVKSCLLLAGLYAQGETCIIEPSPSRDHTERMLKTFGFPLVQNDRQICMQSGGELHAVDFDIPADISSAAFFIVAATIIQHSHLIIRKVGVNPTRLGVINILRQMGANIELHNQHWMGSEPVADIHVQSAQLSGIDIPNSQVPLAIDELPVLLIAAACAQGTTVLRGAQELRVKESDRIAAMAAGLTQLGLKVEVLEDGMVVEGGRLQGGSIDSFGDHRIAMSFMIAGCVASSPVIVEDCANIQTSFPVFVETLRALDVKVHSL